MDFSSLTPFPADHIAEDRRRKEKRYLVRRVRLKDLSAISCSCWNFRAGEDWWMAVRILCVYRLALAGYHQGGQAQGRRQTAAGLPLVLYNGGKAWKAPTDLRDLLLPHRQSLNAYQPQQQYFLLDAGRVPEETLAGNSDLATPAHPL